MTSMSRTSDRYWNGQIAIFLRLTMRDKRIIVHRRRPCGRYAVWVRGESGTAALLTSARIPLNQPSFSLQTSDRCDGNWLSVHPPEQNQAWHHKSSQVKLQSPQTATHPLHPAEIPLSVLSFIFNAFFFFNSHIILKYCSAVSHSPVSFSRPLSLMKNARGICLCTFSRSFLMIYRSRAQKPLMPRQRVTENRPTRK